MQAMRNTWNLNYVYKFFFHFAKCDPNFILEYHIGDFVLSVGLNEIGIKEPDSTACALLLQSPDDPDLYTDHSSWTIALPFFNLYCFAFNYEKNVAGVSRKLNGV